MRVTRIATAVGSGLVLLATGTVQAQEPPAVEAGYDLDDRWTVSGGYRTVEGGGDVDSVCAFAWLRYGVVSLEHRF